MESQLNMFQTINGITTNDGLYALDEYSKKEWKGAYIKMFEFDALISFIKGFNGETLIINTQMNQECFRVLKNNRHIKHVALDIDVCDDVDTIMLPCELIELCIEIIQINRCIHFEGDVSLKLLLIGKINMYKAFMIQRLNFKKAEVTVNDSHDVELVIHMIESHQELKAIKITTTTQLATHFLSSKQYQCCIQFIFHRRDYLYLPLFLSLKWRFGSNVTYIMS